MATIVYRMGIRRGFCTDCSCKELYRDPLHGRTHRPDWWAYCGHSHTADKEFASVSNTMVTMLGKLEEVKGAFCGDDPSTFLNTEDRSPVWIGQKFSHHLWTAVPLTKEFQDPRLIVSENCSSATVRCDERRLPSTKSGPLDDGPRVFERFLRGSAVGRVGDAQ
ncbi:hypothetical protein ISCGN_014070 [Ixodes scapularis]